MENTPSVAARRGYIDAMKGLGILLVVFGHFEEYYRGAHPFFNATFECIYLFHMALFCICSGLVAKFTLRRFFTQQLWLYAVGQVLMYLFRMAVLKENFAETGGQLAALLLPWRHMWYLFALLFWELTVPLLAWLRGRWGAVGPLVGMVGATALALWAGTQEIPFSYVRVFSFYPFFAFGVLFRECIDAWYRLGQRYLALRWLPGLAALCVYGTWFRDIITAPEPVYEGVRIWQDGSYTSAYTMLDRGLFYVVGVLTTLALINALGNCRTFQSLGRRTLPVYLLHMPALAFLIELGVYNMDGRPMLAIVAWVILLTGGITCFFASAPVNALFNTVANLWYKVIPGLFQRAKSHLTQ